MHRSTWIACAAVFAAALAPCAAAAGERGSVPVWRCDDRSGPRWRRAPVVAPRPAAYVLLKGGAMHLEAGSGTEGGFFGVEFGSRVTGMLDVGFAVDYFHRGHRDVSVLFETSRGFEPPIRAEVTAFESTTDLVPVGITLRGRIPAGAVTPFVAGTLAYEVLHVRFFEAQAPPRPYADIVGTAATLAGMAWQVAAGVELSVAPGVGLVGEVGLHRGRPSRGLDLDGLPVDLRVRMDGSFLRAGVRVGL